MIDNISENGIEFIAEFEGCRLSAYDDLQPYKTLDANTKILGTLTIGIGHIGNVDGKKITWNTKITKTKAYRLFRSDIEPRAEKLKSLINTTITQNMFDALLSYAYNCGFGNQHFVNAINLINKGKFKSAAKEIKNGTCTSKGVVLNGLVRRRNAEYELFIKDMVYTIQTTKSGVALRKAPAQTTTIIKKYPVNTVLEISKIKTVLNKRYGKTKDGWINLKYTKRI